MIDEGVEATLAEGNATEAVVPLPRLTPEELSEIKRWLGGEDQIGANVD